MNKRTKIVDILIILIVILGIVVRIIYINKTPYNQRQHDVVIASGKGSLKYAYIIFEEGHLPNSNEEQYYHPPLSQIMNAFWLKIFNNFYNNQEQLNESLQYLTLIYSIIIIYIFYKILDELKLNNKVKLLLMFLVTFHPTLIILSGSINNDELCLMLSLVSIWRLIKWYKKDTMTNIAILAIVTGLAVMTKLSAAVIAVPIIFVFLRKLYKEIKESKDKNKVLLKYIKMYIFFGCISLPIGLWYPIRNYILFGQPIMYIADPKSKNLYVGNYSIWDRLKPVSNEINTMFCNPVMDYNIPTYLLKCSLFGEFSWTVVETKQLILNKFYYIALYTNIILIIYSIFCTAKNIKCTNKKNNIWKYTLLVLNIFSWISFISVNIKLPYGCTMDFRYMLLNLFVGITFIGFELDKRMENNRKIANIEYSIIFTLAIVMIVTSNWIVLL